MTLSAGLLPSGTTIGSYRVDRVIADGDFATVYEAAHVILPRRAALKLLRAEVVGHPHTAQRLVREACVLEAFAHPGVADVFDCGFLPDGRSWIAMALVGGEPLATAVRRSEPMAVVAVLELAIGVVEILAAAHRSGIVHRELVPAHVMIGDGGVHGVRILGWGRAHQPGRGHDLIGDRRADVLAAGALIYEAATGRAAFPPAAPLPRVTTPFPQPLPVRMLRPEVAPALAAIIEAMLAADPGARPDAAVVAEQLDRLERHPDAAHAVATAARPDAGSALVVAPPAPSTVDRDWDALAAMDAVPRLRAATPRPLRSPSREDTHPLVPQPAEPGSRADRDALSNEFDTARLHRGP